MKRIVLLLTLPLLIGAQAMADEGGTAKLVKLADKGGVYAYPISENPTVTYTKDGTSGLFVVTVGSDELMNLDRSKVSYYTYTQKTFNLSDVKFATQQTITAKAYGAALLTRTLQPGVWNTFCIPFDMTSDQVSLTFGEGTKLRTYAGHDGTTLKFAEATEIEAGKAYLIMPAQLTENPVIVGEENDHHFDDINVTLTEPENGVDADGYGLQGRFYAADIKTDGTNLFINANGKLVVPSSDPIDADAGIYMNTLKGMRAYIVLPADAASNARRFTLDIDGNVTGISAIDGNASASASDAVYGIDGRRAGTSLTGLPKGLYVVGGRKVVVK